MIVLVTAMTLAGLSTLSTKRGPLGQPRALEVAVGRGRKKRSMPHARRGSLQEFLTKDMPDPSPLRYLELLYEEIPP